MKKHGPNSENISQAVFRLGTEQRRYLDVTGHFNGPTAARMYAISIIPNDSALYVINENLYPVSRVIELVV